MKISKTDLKTIVRQRLASLLKEDVAVVNDRKHITKSKLKKVVSERLAQILNESRPIARNVRTGKVTKWDTKMSATDELLAMVDYAEESTENFEKRLSGARAPWEFGLSNSDHNKAKEALRSWTALKSEAGLAENRTQYLAEEATIKYWRRVKALYNKNIAQLRKYYSENPLETFSKRADINLERRIKRLAFDKAIIIADAEWFKTSFAKINIPAQPSFFDLLKQESAWKTRELVGGKKTAGGFIVGDGDKLADLRFTRNRLIRWLSGLEEIPRSSKTMEARKNIFAKILTGETVAALENKQSITPDDMNKVKALIYKTEKENGFKKGELWDGIHHDLESEFKLFAKETRGERRRRSTPRSGTEQIKKRPRKERTIGLHGKWDPVVGRNVRTYGKARSIWGPGGGLADEFRIFALLRSMGDPVILADDLWNNIFSQGQIWGLDLYSGTQSQGPGVFGKFPSGRGLPEEIIEDLTFFKDNILKRSKAVKRMEKLPPLRKFTTELKQVLFPGILYDDKDTRLLQKEFAKESKKMIDRYSLGINKIEKEKLVVTDPKKGKAIRKKVYLPAASSIAFDVNGNIVFLDKDGKPREKNLSRAQKRIVGKNLVQIETDIKNLYEKSLENYTAKQFIESLPREGDHLHRSINLDNYKGRSSGPGSPEDYNMKLKGGYAVMPETSVQPSWFKWYAGTGYSPEDYQVGNIKNAKEAGRYVNDRRMLNALRNSTRVDLAGETRYFGREEAGQLMNKARLPDNLHPKASFRKKDIRLDDGTFIYLEDLESIKKGESILLGEYGKRYVFPIKFPWNKIMRSEIRKQGTVYSDRQVRDRVIITELASDKNLEIASPRQRATIRTSLIIASNAIDDVLMPHSAEGSGRKNTFNYDAIKGNGVSMSQVQIDIIKKHMLDTSRGRGGWRMIESKAESWLNSGVPKYIKDEWADYDGYFSEDGERIKYQRDTTHSGKPVNQNLIDQYKLEKEILKRKAFTDAILSYEKEWLEKNLSRRSVVIGGRSRAENLARSKSQSKTGKKSGAPRGPYPIYNPDESGRVPGEGGWKKRQGFTSHLRWVLNDREYIEMVEHMRANPGERVFIPQIVREYWSQVRNYPTGRGLPGEILADIRSLLWDYVDSAEYALGEHFSERWGGGRFGKQWKNDKLWKQYVINSMPEGLGDKSFGSKMLETDEEGRPVKDNKGKKVYKAIPITNTGKAARVDLKLKSFSADILEYGDYTTPMRYGVRPQAQNIAPPKYEIISPAETVARNFGESAKVKSEKWIKSNLWKKLNPKKSPPLGGNILEEIRKMYMDLLARGVPEEAAAMVISSNRPYSLIDEQIIDNLLDDKLTKDIKISNYKNILQQQMSSYIESGRITAKQAETLASRITNEAWEKGLNQYIIQTDIGLQKASSDMKHVDEIVRKINNASNVPAPVRKAFSGAGKALPPAMILLMGYALVDIWDDETANYSDDETIAEKMRQTMVVVDPTIFGVQTVSGFSDILFKDNPDWKIMDWKNLIPGHIALSRIGGLRDPEVAKKKSREHAEAFAAGIQSAGIGPSEGTFEFCMQNPEDDWCKENAPVMWLEFCHENPNNLNCKKKRDQIKNFKQGVFDKFMDPIKEEALEKIIGEKFDLPKDICDNVQGASFEQKQKECNRLKKLAYQQYLMKGVYKLIAKDKKLTPEKAFEKLLSDWKKITLQKCKEIPGSPCGPDNNMSPLPDWDARQAAKSAPEATVELGAEEEFEMTFEPDPMIPKDRIE